MAVAVAFGSMLHAGGLLRILLWAIGTRWLPGPELRVLETMQAERKAGSAPHGILERDAQRLLLALEKPKSKQAAAAANNLELN